MKESNATIGINTFWAHWSSLEWLHFIYCHPFNKLCIAGLCILQLDEIWKDILPSWVFQNLRKQHLLLFQTSLCNLMEPLFNDSFYKFSNWLLKYAMLSIGWITMAVIIHAWDLCHFLNLLACSFWANLLVATSSWQTRIASPLCCLVCTTWWKY